MKMYIHTKTYTQNVRSSCLCNCHGNMETIQISFYRWKVKLLVHPDRGTPLSNKEEQTIDTGRSLNRSRGTVWWKQPVSKCRILPGSVYITYSRPQIYKDGEQVSGTVQWLAEAASKVGAHIHRGKLRRSLQAERHFVSCSGGGYMRLHVKTPKKDTHKKTVKTE